MKKHLLTLALLITSLPAFSEYLPTYQCDLYVPELGPHLVIYNNTQGGRTALEIHSGYPMTYSYSDSISYSDGMAYHRFESGTTIVYDKSLYDARTEWIDMRFAGHIQGIRIDQQIRCRFFHTGWED